MTIVHRDHRFIYLKSHKTASTSIEMYLIRETPLGGDAYATSKDIRKYGYPRKRNCHSFFPYWTRITQHGSAEETRRVVGRKTWEQSFKVSSIRNPWDMLVSQFEWERSGRAGRSVPQNAPWAQWLDDALTPASGERWSKAESKIFRHLFIDGDYVLDGMIFFEDLDGSIKQMQSRLDVTLPSFATQNINEKRTQRNRDYRSYYSDEQAVAVKGVFAPVLALFPYEFDKPGSPPIRG